MHKKTNALKYLIKNGGSSRARQLGIDKSKGEYVSFIDCDDTIKPDFIERLVYLIEEYNADISQVNIYNDYGIEFPKWQFEVIEDKEIISAFLNGKICNRIMNKLYRREILKSFDFPIEKSLMEDARWTSEVLNRCNKIVIDPSPYYYYRYVSDSLSHKKLKSKEKIFYSFENNLHKFEIISRKIEKKDYITFEKIVIDWLEIVLWFPYDLETDSFYRRLRNLVSCNIFANTKDEAVTSVKKYELSKKASHSFRKIYLKSRNKTFNNKCKKLAKYFIYSICN